MMQGIGYVLYSLGIFFYTLALYITSWFNPKAKLFVNGRKGIFTLIKERLQQESRKKIWFHCASLGEFEQARPVIEGIKERHPQYSILVTFFSPSGYEVRKNYPHADYIFYLPIDSASNAKKLLKLFDPSVVFFVKYEFWYHYLSHVHKQHIPLYLISANFRKDQVFFRWYGSFYKNILSFFDLIFTQNEASKQLLKEIGITNVLVSKDTRFDRVYHTTLQARELPVINAFKGNATLLVAGSSYVYEENLIKDYLSQASTGCKVIIAPHEIDAAHVQAIQQLFAHKKTLLYSEATEQNSMDAEVLIINNIGLLASIYRYADIALIGGGFGKKGLHNTLEAATFGIPVLFGPNNHDKFPEAQQLIDAGAAHVINTIEEFTALINSYIQHEDKRKETGTKARNFILENLGSTDIILNHTRL